ncbi:MAG: lysophospholipid acyltransferase family protein [Myxococcota bacterium]|nr:lysophospholipid acyltransferase family protein [Myxococcota bacterium]
MLRAPLSALFWVFIAVTSLVIFPIALLTWIATTPFDRRKRALHWVTCFWASLYTWLNPAWPTSVHHRDRLDSNEARVYVANHLSLVDILVLFRLFSHFKWVSKIENFRVPLIGWNMYLNGYVPLTRGHKHSVVKMMARCDQLLADGNSIMMFPEGTRSTSGRMRRFKLGAFELALRNQVPLQPIAIRGTGNALPKRGFVLQGRHPISIDVLEPIRPDQYGQDDAEALALRVRRALMTELGEPTDETTSAENAAATV